MTKRLPSAVAAVPLALVLSSGLLSTGPGAFLGVEFTVRAAETPEQSQQPADRSTSVEDYMDQAGRTMREWQVKVDAYLEEARREGRQAAKAAGREVEDAWENVRDTWDRLQKASDAAWEDAREGFERSWDSFQETWTEAEKQT